MLKLQGDVEQEAVVSFFQIEASDFADPAQAVIERVAMNAEGIGGSQRMLVVGEPRIERATQRSVALVDASQLVKRPAQLFGLPARAEAG